MAIVQTRPSPPMLGFVDKFVMFVLLLVRHVFFWVIIIVVSRVESVEVIVENVPHVVHAVESNFIQLYTNQCVSMTRHDTEMHGNNPKPRINRMTLSPDTLRLLGKILFVIVLPISKSC